MTKKDEDQQVQQVQELTSEQRKAAAICLSANRVSVSMVQRTMNIGYNTAQELCQSIIDAGLVPGLPIAPNLTAAPNPPAPKQAQEPVKVGTVLTDARDHAIYEAGVKAGKQAQEPVELNCQEIASYVARYGGNCRDCADENGICPSSGMPCDSRKAISHVLTALDYGLKHGYITAALPAPKQAQEPVGYTDNTGMAFAVKWSGVLPPNVTLYAAPKQAEPEA
jgi:hypothetical protein